MHTLNAEIDKEIKHLKNYQAKIRAKNKVENELHKQKRDEINEKLYKVIENLQSMSCAK